MPRCQFSLAGIDMKNKLMEVRGRLLGKAVLLTWSPSRLQEGRLQRWEGGADGPGGAGATQFHGVFSADVSVVTHARVQFGH